MNAEEMLRYLEERTTVEGDVVTYQGIAGAPSNWIRPWVPITVDFVVAGQRVTGGAFAILDSGADETTLPWRAVEPTGASWDDLPQAGKEDQEKYHELFSGFLEPLRRLDGEVRWRGHLITSRPLVCPPTMGVSDAVLGMDFFALFEVTFRWGENPPSFSIAPRGV